VYKVHPLTKKKTKVTKSYPIWGTIALVSALIIFAYNYTIPREPSFTHTPSIIMGNSSKNISNEDTIRLQYLQNNFVIVKLSTADVPSRWDIDNLDIDDNRDYWQVEAVEPFWDCHIIKSNNSWTIIHIELYFSRNGANPVGEKHSHDFEELNFYFRSNDTVPSYVSFPTYKGLTEHPHELLDWYDMPKSGDKYALRLDSSTNAFSENYDVFPKINQNVRPVLISPETSELSSYLSDLETTIVIVSFSLMCLIFLYMVLADKFRHKYYLLILILFLMTIYPIITLQYDFVQGASFRVWTDGEHPDTLVWYESTEGRAYIEGYNDLPYYRKRWTTPTFADELGIEV
jgi:hypothetical protein